MNAIAKELNAIIEKGNPHVLEMLSTVGKNLFFPKGILSQSAEAKQKAQPKFNATIGIATENGRTMCLDTIYSQVNTEMLTTAETLTYAPSFGIPALRKAWQESLFAKNKSLAGKTVSLPVVTNGITHGISVFADMFIDPDDVVLFPDKMWGNNNLIMTTRRGARIEQYTMFTQDGGFNTAALAEKLKAKAADCKKLIIVLNFPNNPTGYTITAAERDTILDILKDVAAGGTSLILVHDDAYFGLRYDEAAIDESLFAHTCGLHPRILAVKLDGATKEMFVWGLRVGFVTYGISAEGDPKAFYDALERKTAGDVRGSISNASHLGQTIVLKAMQSPDFETQRQAKVAILTGRARKVKKILSNARYSDAWEVYPFNSGYFMCLKLKTVDAEKLRVHLLDTYGVGLIAISATDLRIAFSCVDEANIEALFDYIYKGIKDLEQKQG